MKRLLFRDLSKSLRDVILTAVAVVSSLLLIPELQDRYSLPWWAWVIVASWLIIAALLLSHIRLHREFESLTARVLKIAHARLELLEEEIKSSSPEGRG